MLRRTVILFGNIYCELPKREENSRQLAFDQNSAKTRILNKISLLKLYPHTYPPTHTTQSYQHSIQNIFSLVSHMQAMKIHEKSQKTAEKLAVEFERKFGSLIKFQPRNI
jgi:hypothetical protein